MTKSTPPTHLVLYADDDAEDIEFVEESFSKNLLNIELITFQNGQAVIEYLNHLPVLSADPCLIILDINMPVLNGKDTLIKIRTIDRFKETPVVLFTTSSLEQDKLFAEKNKAGFMVKPLDGSQMNKITEDFIAHCQDEIRRDIKKRSN